MANIHYSITLAVLVSALLFCFPEVALAEQTSTRCDHSIIQLLGRKLGLADFSYPTDGMYPSRENGGLIIATACKNMPADHTKTIAAIVYDEEPGNDFGKRLYVVVVDIQKKIIIGTYNDSLGVDAVTEWHSDSLTIDTGRYLLAPGTRAFGLRTNTFREGCAFEGGYDDELTLFVLNGKSIRPVLSESMLHWYYGNADRCDRQDVPRIEAYTSISVQPTSSNGFSDLKFTATFSNKKKPISAVIKYSGSVYDLEPWKKVFGTWWQ